MTSDLPDGPRDPLAPIVDHVVHCRYADIPAAARNAVKKSIIDIIACTFAGSITTSGRILAETVKRWDGRAQSTLLPHGRRLSRLDAAFANAIIARSSELDDVHEGDGSVDSPHGGHVSVCIVPAVLALAESVPAPVSGRDLIAAIAVGADLIIRLRLAGAGGSRIGWMTETLAPFGVAAAAARINRLSVSQTANALGTAYAFCCGNNLSMEDGSWDIVLAAGNGARGGLVAAELAQQGYMGSRFPFLGRCGLYPLYFRGHYDAHRLFDNLGTTFENADVTIKPYAACMFTHQPINNLLALMETHDLGPGDIRCVSVRLSEYAARLTAGANRDTRLAPGSLFEAQNSLPFVLATAAVTGDVFPDTFTDGNLQDPRILAFSRKVCLLPTSADQDMIIETNDGKIITKPRDLTSEPTGKTFSFGACVEKLERCVRLARPSADMQRYRMWAEEIAKLDTLPEASSLLSLLYPETG